MSAPYLPSAEILAADLRKMHIDKVAEKHGITRKAINIKMKRAGMPLGKPLKPKPPKASSPVQMAKVEAEFQILAVTRTTATGATGTLPRVSFIDGPVPGAHIEFIQT